MGCHFKTHLTTSSSLKINKQINNPLPGLFECAGRLGGWRRTKVTSGTSALQRCDCQGREESLFRSHPRSEGWDFWGNCPHPFRVYRGHPLAVQSGPEEKGHRDLGLILRISEQRRGQSWASTSCLSQIQTWRPRGAFSVPPLYRRKHLLGSPQSPEDPFHCCSPILCLLHFPKRLLMFATHRG